MFPPSLITINLILAKDTYICTYNINARLSIFTLASVKSRFQYCLNKIYKRKVTRFRYDMWAGDCHRKHLPKQTLNQWCSGSLAPAGSLFQGSGLYEEGGLLPDWPGSEAWGWGEVEALARLVGSFWISSGSSCPACGGWTRTLSMIPKSCASIGLMYRSLSITLSKWGQQNTETWYQDVTQYAFN